MSRDEQRSTLSALLEDQPKRGRPRHAVSRQNVYVELSAKQKSKLGELAERLPQGFQRADIPDLATVILTARLDKLRRSVAGRNREMPEGIVDMAALHLLWDLPLPDGEPQKWTSIRLSPQQVIQLGREHGVLHALFGASRSQVFGLGLALLEQALQQELSDVRSLSTLDELKTRIGSLYL